MSDSSKQKENFWSIIGKISVLLGLVVALFAIYNHAFSNDEPELIVYAYPETFRYPPNLDEAIKKSKEVMSYSNIDSQIAKTLKEKEFKNLNSHDLASNLAGFAKELWPNILRNGAPEYDGHISFIIKNVGRSHAESVVFELPLYGLATVSATDRDLQVIEFSKILNLGSIRGESDLLVRVWSKDTLNKYEYDELNVTHKKGIAEIKIANHIFGVFDALNESLGAFIALVPVVLYFLLAIVYHSGVEVGRKRLVDNKKRSEEGDRTAS